MKKMHKILWLDDEKMIFDRLIPVLEKHLDISITGVTHFVGFPWLVQVKSRDSQLRFCLDFTGNMSGKSDRAHIIQGVVGSFSYCSQFASFQLVPAPHQGF